MLIQFFILTKISIIKVNGLPLWKNFAYNLRFSSFYCKIMKFLIFIAILQIALSILIPKCTDKNQIVLPFTDINGKPDSTTTASMCHDGYFLNIKWEATDSEIISTYKNCNDPLYKEDVVEIFVSTIDSYPQQYYELQVSPKSQLFFADISNPSGTCSNLGTEYQSCGSANYKAELTVKGWRAELSIALKVIGRGTAQSKYKVNLFRVDYSTKEATRYLTWRPTYANPACFHKPAYFEEITLG